MRFSGARVGPDSDVGRVGPALARRRRVVRVDDGERLVRQQHELAGIGVLDRPAHEHLAAGRPQGARRGAGGQDGGRRGGCRRSRGPQHERPQHERPQHERPARHQESPASQPARRWAKASSTSACTTSPSNGSHFRRRRDGPGQDRRGEGDDDPAEGRRCLPANREPRSTLSILCQVRPPEARGREAEATAATTRRRSGTVRWSAHIVREGPGHKRLNRGRIGGGRGGARCAARPPVRLGGGLWPMPALTSA